MHATVVRAYAEGWRVKSMASDHVTVQRVPYIVCRATARHTDGVKLLADCVSLHSLRPLLDPPLDDVWVLVDAHSGSVMGAAKLMRIRNMYALTRNVDEMSAYDPHGSTCYIRLIVASKEGGHLRDAIVHMARADLSVNHICGVTRCSHRYNKLVDTYASYALSTRDPHVAFHVAGGAIIRSLLPAYRPDDHINEGCGILISYNAHTFAHDDQIVNRLHAMLNVLAPGVDKYTPLGDALTSSELTYYAADVTRRFAPVDHCAIAALDVHTLALHLSQVVGEDAVLITWGTVRHEGRNLPLCTHARITHCAEMSSRGGDITQMTPSALLEAFGPTLGRTFMPRHLPTPLECVRILPDVQKLTCLVHIQLHGEALVEVASEISHALSLRVFEVSDAPNLSELPALLNPSLCFVSIVGTACARVPELNRSVQRLRVKDNRMARVPSLHAYDLHTFEWNEKCVSPSEDEYARLECDSKHHRVRLIRDVGIGENDKEGGGKDLVVVFLGAVGCFGYWSNVVGIFANMRHRIDILVVTDPLGVDSMYLNDTRNSVRPEFYRTLVAAYSSAYERTIGIGISMGFFGVLACESCLTHVLLFNPSTPDMMRRFRDLTDDSGRAAIDAVASTRRVTWHYGRASVSDVMMTVPFQKNPNIKWVVHDTDSHSIAKWLHMRQEFIPAVEAAAYDARPANSCGQK